ncbi:MAG: hypothetical protein R2711_04130 [Acidimicrobiales bacterium]
MTTPPPASASAPISATTFASTSGWRMSSMIGQEAVVEVAGGRRTSSR